MPRISLYRENHSNDYRFQDQRILELFTMSGVGINIHKYTGTYATAGTSNDATLPTYKSNTEQAIQDLLFLENRDRKYDKNIYALRGHYTIQDNDFNLSQFGMFLTNDTIYVTVHINDMVRRLGRKIIPGDVFEMPNLRDFWPLDESIPAALRKFYVVQETTRASEGFAQTWYPHLWRCKCVPMIDGQEYRDILDDINNNEPGSSTSAAATAGTTLRDMLSTYNQNLVINDAIVAQAEATVPRSGYDVSNLFTLSTDGTGPTTPYSADNNHLQSDSNKINADSSFQSTDQTVSGYLTGGGTAPNNAPVTAATSFPDMPQKGQYILRLDYMPNRLFRWDGNVWVAIQDLQRQPITGNKNTSLLGTFVNNNNTVKVGQNRSVESRQALSTLLKPQPDLTK